MAMEVSVCHGTQTPNLPSFRPQRKIKHHRPETGLSFKVGKWGLNCGLAVRCATSEAEIEKEWEAEMNPDKEEWMASVGWLRHKCGEKRGVVELLECLEREAIMGEDEGREPTDYNRRAQIFHKSSSVFQALKERKASSRELA
ncbi:uncharacterized protein LOC133862879 [Alnus glutinosa]|uniref:uncharacterized protein LOC133862879 n=1 Tax=Alnus glutinosa TaxID=3517 RepID=UPI002D7787C1|nr:uncharacterized protein LOC133862879 [Alnus glutinosa]